MAVVNLQSRKTRILPARTKRVTKPEANYQRIPVNPNQRVVIMAAGMCTRWKNYLGCPKQLAPVNGEAEYYTENKLIASPENQMITPAETQMVKKPRKRRKVKHDTNRS